MAKFDCFCSSFATIFSSVWTILLALQLDGVLDWSFVPLNLFLWACVPSVACSVPLFYANWRQSREKRQEEKLFFFAIVHGIGFSVSLLLLSLKLDGSLGSSYYVVFLPFWIAAAAPCCQNMGSPRDALDTHCPSIAHRILMILENFTIFFSVFLLLVTLQLEGVVDWSWWVVFSPIWALDLILVLFFLGEVQLMVSNFFRQDEQSVSVCVGSLLFAAAFVFQLLLAARANGGEMDFSLVFIPLWIFQAMFCCAHCAFGLRMMGDHYR